MASLSRHTAQSTTAVPAEVAAGSAYMALAAATTEALRADVIALEESAAEVAWPGPKGSRWALPGVIRDDRLFFPFQMRTSAAAASSNLAAAHAQLCAFELERAASDARHSADASNAAKTEMQLREVALEYEAELQRLRAEVSAATEEAKTVRKAAAMESATAKDVVATATRRSSVVEVRV